MDLHWIVVLPMAGSVLTALCARRGRRAAAVAAACSLGGALLLLCALAPRILGGHTVEAHRPWIPSLGMNLSFYLDGLSLTFGGLVLGIGLLVVLYAVYYMPATDRLGRFGAYLLLFASSMLGVVLSGDLLLLFVCWELTGLTSFLLVGYRSRDADARRGARMALTVTSAGGLALLAGFLLLGEICGTYRICEILQMGERVRGHPWYAPALLLILVGAFSKSAQVPFHFWLPAAMAAPTPVSAYLHSATMVKAGVFLLARLFPVLSGTPLWFHVVGAVGLATLLLGAATALFKHDLKELLAYSTISHLGLVTLLFGFGTPLGAVAGVFHVINHAAFKASLFMAAGIIDHEAGTRDMRRLHGLWSCMPHTATLAMVSAAAMAGVPLLNGFLSKEMFFAEAVHQEWMGSATPLLPLAAVAAGVFSVAYSIRFIHDVFLDTPPQRRSHAPHEPPRWMKVPVEVLVFICLLVGVLPNLTVRPILDVAAAGVLQGPVPDYRLDLWHGLAPPFLMSLAALAGGTLLYAFRARLFRLHERLFQEREPGLLHERALDALGAAARGFLLRMDNGSLSRYTAVLLAAAVVLGAWPWVVRGGDLIGSVGFSPPDGLSFVAVGLLTVAALATVRMRAQRLAAVLNAGVVGLIVTLTFVHFSAPDLALTQIMVEVVCTVLLLLVLYFLPAEPPAPAARRVRAGRAGLAAVAGAGAAALLLGVLTRSHAPVSDFFLAESKPGAGGSNVVNTILVDFRGFDTLGEITVLALAAVGIFSLLDGLRLRSPDRDARGRPWAADSHPFIMATLSRPLLPLALLVAVFIFLRGHNLPGGGFIAGLIVASALILQHLASGIRWAQERLRFRFLPLVSAGLFVTALTGLASLAFGRAFLTSAVFRVELPVLGKVEVTSSLAFDLGVFLAVVGTVMLILVSIGKLGEGPGRVPHPRETRGESR